MNGVTIRGLAQAKADVARLNPKRQRNAERTGLKAGGKVLADAASRKAPSETGRLRREKIQVYTTTNAGKPRVIVAVGRIGAMQELGTSPHTIKAGESRTVGFQDARGKTRVFRTKGSARRVLVTAEGRVLGTTVRHPGTRAKPFLRPALAETQDQIAQAYGDAYLAAAVRQTALAAKRGE